MPQVAVKWLYFPPIRKSSAIDGFFNIYECGCVVSSLKTKIDIQHYWSFSDYVLGEKCECFVFNFVVVMVLALPIVQSSLCFFFLSNPPHPTNVNVQTQTSYWLQVEIYSPNVLLNAHHNLVTNRLPPYGSYRLELMQGEQGSRNMCFALFSVKMKV